MVAEISVWNERIIAEYRANAGHVSWSTEDDLAAGRPVPPRLPGFGEGQGAPIILVHHTGARTGRKRISPLMFQLVGEDFAVFATYGGRPDHPAWYRNLVANPSTAVELGTVTVAVMARLVEGAERERIWADQTAAMPVFARFAESAGRRIPVLLLERTDDSSARETH